MAERNYAPVHEVTMYQARCTHCGRVETDYGDYTAMGDPHAPIEQVTEFWGWWEVVEWTPDPNRAEVPNARVGETVELLCPNCQECEVCGARAYPLDSHLVCEDHEDTFTNTASSLDACCVRHELRFRLSGSVSYSSGPLRRGRQLRHHPSAEISLVRRQIC